jgi:hypothetical protein
VAKETKKDLELGDKDAAGVKGGAARPEKTRPEMKKSVKRPGIKKV